MSAPRWDMPSVRFIPRSGKYSLRAMFVVARNIGIHPADTQIRDCSRLKGLHVFSIDVVNL